MHVGSRLQQLWLPVEEALSCWTERWASGLEHSLLLCFLSALQWGFLYKAHVTYSLKGLCHWKRLCLKAGEAVNKREVIVYLKMEQKMVISLNGFWKNGFSVSRSFNHYLVCTENWSAITSWLRFSSFGWSYYKKTLWFKKKRHSGISRCVVVDKDRVRFMHHGYFQVWVHKIDTST